MLDRRVLVLNRNWQPVNIVGMRRAVALMFTGQASMILREGSGTSVMALDSWISHSRKSPPERGLCAGSVTLHAPEVLLLSDYARSPRHEVRFSRRNVFSRDECRCQYCGGRFDEAELNLDHVVPRDRGGRTVWENIVTACLRCNSRKADRLPHQAGMKLAHAPARPSWRSFTSRTFSPAERAAWHDFWPVDEKKFPAGSGGVSSGAGNRTLPVADKYCV